MAIQEDAIREPKIYMKQCNKGSMPLAPIIVSIHGVVEFVEIPNNKNELKEIFSSILEESKLFRSLVIGI